MPQKKINDETMGLIEEIVREQQARVRAFIFSRTHNRDVVDDLTQDVFLVLVEKINDLDLTRPMWPFLAGVTANMLRRYWQKKNSELQTDSIDELIGREEERLLMSGEPTEEFSENRQEAMMFCMDSLKPESERMITMAYSDEHSTDEIAGYFSKKAGAIRVMLHRIRTILLNCIRKRIEELA